MTDDQPAAIQATFSDVKLIRSRKVCQLVLEIPLEQADAALSTLGGIPQPHSERWVALARLNGQATKQAHDEVAEKRHWEDLKLSMQAGIRCDEASFQRFLWDRHFYSAANAEEAAEGVRHICDVDSRSGLNNNPEAAAKWRDLDRSYQAWLKVADA
jgi:hypothetical protein